MQTGDGEPGWEQSGTSKSCHCIVRQLIFCSKILETLIMRPRIDTLSFTKSLVASVSFCHGRSLADSTIGVVCNREGSASLAARTGGTASLNLGIY